MKRTFLVLALALLCCGRLPDDGSELRPGLWPLAIVCGPLWCNRV